MKSLNYKEINQAFNRFLVWFASLLLTTVACVFLYIKASSNQFNRLVQQKEDFDQIFYKDALLADKVDSLYTYMSLLNTSQIRDDHQMQRLITKKKEEYTKLVNQERKNRPYFLVYNRLFSHVNEMLLLKDSLNRAMLEESDMRSELKDCLQRAVNEHRQRKRTN